MGIIHLTLRRQITK